MKTLEQLRDELGIVPHGRVKGGRYVLFHLTFRMDEDIAKQFILGAAKKGISESLYGQQAIINQLKEVKSETK